MLVLGSVVLMVPLLMFSLIDDACLEANLISLVRVTFPANSDFVENTDKFVAWSVG